MLLGPNTANVDQNINRKKITDVCRMTFSLGISGFPTQKRKLEETLVVNASLQLLSDRKARLNFESLFTIGTS